jgi:hypothetical protein
MKMSYPEITMKWNKIKNFINPTIRLLFENDENENEINIEKYRAAEASTTAFLRNYIPCFSANSQGLSHIWAAIFNFSFIGDANEKNTDGFSQISTNYDKAIDFLNSEQARTFCDKQKAQASINIGVDDLIKIGSVPTIKF